MDPKEAKSKRKKLKAQFRKWAKDLAKRNPECLKTPWSILSYLRSPNWDHPDPAYAHYKVLVKTYGDELVAEFEKLRALPMAEAKVLYTQHLMDAGYTVLHI